MTSNLPGNRHLKAKFDARDCFSTETHCPIWIIHRMSFLDWCNISTLDIHQRQFSETSFHMSKHQIFWQFSFKLIELFILPVFFNNKHFSNNNPFRCVYGPFLCWNHVNWKACLQLATKWTILFEWRSWIYQPSIRMQNLAANIKCCGSIFGRDPHLRLSWVLTYLPFSSTLKASTKT